MPRHLAVAAAQLGPIARSESRSTVIRRLIALMREARVRGAELVVYPEMALTTFFPRWELEDESELHSFFEWEMPGPDTVALFDEARRLGIAFYLGYCEGIYEAGRRRRYNTSILVGADGVVIGKYRKVHLPGTSSADPSAQAQYLERRYFDPGDLGFPVWRALGGVLGMCLCNDRRWPETYRVMALQSVELILLGYNTPARLPDTPEHDHLRMFHNHLPMQAGAYQNTTWVVGVAKAGREEGEDLIGGSCIIAPTGEIVALAQTRGDEIILARIDFDAVFACRKVNFNFALYRRPDQYGLIVERAGALPPPP
ncbi:MAG: N-carbamoyl-D-amino-acid hydrolase [Alphaproteobacteria bacterium]|nr:N-carbamoyl-D-amino-acid hydrolase [Alphaproteobacteria bacterium]